MALTIPSTAHRIAAGSRCPSGSWLRPNRHTAGPATDRSPPTRRRTGRTTPGATHRPRRTSTPPPTESRPAPGQGCGRVEQPAPHRRRGRHGRGPRRVVQRNDEAHGGHRQGRHHDEADDSLDHMRGDPGSRRNLEDGGLLHVYDEPAQGTEVPLPEKVAYLSKVLIHDRERVRSERTGQPIHHDPLIAVERQPQQRGHDHRRRSGDMQEGLVQNAPLPSHRRRGYIPPAGH